MKTRLCILATLVAALNASAQTGSGVVNFANVGVTADKRIYVYEGPGQPVGAGPGYQVALYWGPAGTTFDSLMVQTGPAATLLNGMFAGGNRTSRPLAVNGDVVALQARAWCTGGGLYTTYEMALALGSLAGKGPVFEMATQDPTNPLGPPPTVGLAAGWTGFTLFTLGLPQECVPEPHVNALALIFVGTFVLWHKRRNSVQ